MSVQTVLNELGNVVHHLEGYVRQGTTLSPRETGDLLDRLREVKLDAALTLGAKCERIERLVYALAVAGIEVPK